MIINTINTKTKIHAKMSEKVLFLSLSEFKYLFLYSIFSAQLKIVG